MSASSRPTTIAPSLTLYASLKQAPKQIRSIVALIDPAIGDGRLVVQALASAGKQAGIEVAFGLPALNRECDLLLVLAHGTGEGLSFRIGIGDGLTAHELARRSRARTAIIACCGSARPPPLAVPVNLPVSLLMRGCAHCVGGIWLLPQAPTSRLIASTIGELAAGRTLAEALALVRDGSTNLLDDWGMASVGSIAPWS